MPLVPGSDGAVADVGEARDVAGAHRLSGADQGRRRRWRARHEGGARRRRRWRRRSASPAPRRARRSATTPSISRNISTSPRHIELQVLADSARQRRAFRRARLQPATAAPEAAGGGRLAGAQRRRSATRSAPPPPRRCASSATAMPARWSSSTRTASSPSSR